MSIQKIICHPIVSIGAVVLGIFAGIYFRGFSLLCKPVGEIFLLLLNMCVLPILITSIISSVGFIIADKTRSINIIKMLLCYFSAFLAVEIFSIVFTAIMRPGVLSSEAQDILGTILMDAEGENSTIIDMADESTSGWVMIKNFIPANLFAALANGNSLQVLFSSLAIGIAAGVVERNKQKYDLQTSVIDLCTAFFKIMASILNAFMFLLPLGLFAMTASQIAIIGVDIIKSMARFVVCIYVLCLLIFVICSIVIALSLRITITRAIGGLKDCLLIAFASHSSLASMPIAIENLVKLGVNKSVVNVIVPLGSVIARFSMLILYAASLVFTSQLYEIHIGLIQILHGVLLCLLAGIAGVGAPAVVSISLLSIIFAPIGLPYSAMTTLILVIIAIIDPILTMINVHLNCACAVLLGKRGEEKKDD